MIAYVILEDMTGSIEMMVFSKTLQESAAVIREGEVVITARACDGTYRKGEITLGSANGIASVEGEARKGGSYVYGLDGKRVCPSARLSSLPRGIYILDDRKIVKN